MKIKFDDAATQNLDRMAEKANIKSRAEIIRQSLRLADSLQEQASQGYTEVIVRNPINNKERRMATTTFWQS